LDIQILKGNVTADFRYGGIFYASFSSFHLWMWKWKILRISAHLPKVSKSQTAHF